MNVIMQLTTKNKTEMDPDKNASWKNYWKKCQQKCSQYGKSHWCHTSKDRESG